MTAVDNENKLMCNKGGPKIPMYICTFGHAAVAEFLVGLLMDGRKVFDKIFGDGDGFNGESGGGSNLHITSALCGQTRNVKCHTILNELFAGDLERAQNTHFMFVGFLIFGHIL